MDLPTKVSVALVIVHVPEATPEAGVTVIAPDVAPERITEPCVAAATPSVRAPLTIVAFALPLTVVPVPE